jgi:hypothetical protein
LRAQGHWLTAISRRLGVCFRSVRRYAAANLDGLLAPAIHRSCVPNGNPDYLHQRRGADSTSAGVLHADQACA